MRPSGRGLAVVGAGSVAALAPLLVLPPLLDREEAPARTEALTLCPLPGGPGGEVAGPATGPPATIDVPDVGTSAAAQGGGEDGSGFDLGARGSLGQADVVPPATIDTLPPTTVLLPEPAGGGSGGVGGAGGGGDGSGSGEGGSEGTAGSTGEEAGGGATIPGPPSTGGPATSGPGSAPDTGDTIVDETTIPPTTEALPPTTAPPPDDDRSSTNWWLLLVPLLAALALAALLARRRTPVDGGGAGLDEEDDPILAPSGHRRGPALDLERHLRRSFRDGLRSLDRAGLVPYDPTVPSGRVAHRLAERADPAGFVGAAQIFDEVVYGRRDPTQGDVDAVRSGFSTVLAGPRRADPAVDDTAPVVEVGR